MPEAPDLFDMVKETAYNLEEMLNDSSIDRILAIDTDWNVIAWNQTAEHITGVRKQDILGQRLTDIFPRLKEDDEFMHAVAMALKGKIVFLPSSPGKFQRDFYENHFIPLKTKNGELVGVMNITHDVSHRVKAERELKRLNAVLEEKNAELEKATHELATFTSITGDELKDPVKKIYTALELIIATDGSKLSNPSKAKMRKAQASLNRMNLLLDDILAIAAVSSAPDKFTMVDLQQLMQGVLLSLERKLEEKKAMVDIGQLASVPGSAQMLHYLFYNIIDNALKFQPAGAIPRISISCEPVLLKPDENEALLVSITDNGIGFLQEDAERIFNMFERLHTRQEFPGSGIGLTICRKIVEAHGGYIEAKAEPGKGAGFHCYLPLMQRNEQRQ